MRSVRLFLIGIIVISMTNACGLILTPPQAYVVENEMDQKMSTVKIIDQNLNVGEPLDLGSKSQALTQEENEDAQIDGQIDGQIEN